MKIENNFIINSDGIVIGTLSENASDYERKVISASEDICSISKEFVETINSGKLSLRRFTKEFEFFIKKYEL